MSGAAVGALPKSVRSPCACIAVDGASNTAATNPAAAQRVHGLCTTASSKREETPLSSPGLPYVRREGSIASPLKEFMERASIERSLTVFNALANYVLFGRLLLGVPAPECGKTHPVRFEVTHNSPFCLSDARVGPPMALVRHRTPWLIAARALGGPIAQRHAIRALRDPSRSLRRSRGPESRVVGAT